MIVVLIVAAGAAWEPRALEVLGEDPGIVVLRRCVDVDDLLAAAASGQAEVAVVGLDAPGLDVAAVDHLRRHGVRPVAVVPAERIDAAHARAALIGVTSLVLDDGLDALAAVVAAPEAPATEAGSAGGPGPGSRDDEPELAPTTGGGRVVVVWGPGGAPGRSTVASALAADIARRRRRAILVDADPYGGTIAQQLGIMDEVSGLLSAARLVQSGQLADRIASVQRALDPYLSVVTGLPRADRWVEVRVGTVEELLDVARAHGEVVVDTGFSLEDDPARDFGARPPRNALTLEALQSADEVVVVGSADPVGLSRLARALVELGEAVPGASVRVVVNRMRASLGWSEKDVAGMIHGFARIEGLTFLPDDRLVVDRALVTGHTLAEAGESALMRAVATLVDDLTGLPATPPSARGGGRGLRGLRRRSGGTAARRGGRSA